MNPILIDRDDASREESVFAVLTRELTEEEQKAAADAATQAECSGGNWYDGLQKYLEDLGVVMPAEEKPTKYVCTSEDGTNMPEATCRSNGSDSGNKGSSAYQDPFWIWGRVRRKTDGRIN